MPCPLYRNAYVQGPTDDIDYLLLETFDECKVLGKAKVSKPLSIIIPCISSHLTQCMDILKNGASRGYEFIVVYKGDDYTNFCDSVTKLNLHSCILAYKASNKMKTNHSRIFGCAKAHCELVFFCDADDSIDFDVLDSFVTSLDVGKAYEFKCWKGSKVASDPYSLWSIIFPRRMMLSVVGTYLPNMLTYEDTILRLYVTRGIEVVHREEVFYHYERTKPRYQSFGELYDKVSADSTYLNWLRNEYPDLVDGYVWQLVDDLISVTQGTYSSLMSLNVLMSLFSEEFYKILYPKVEDMLLFRLGCKEHITIESY